MNYGVLGVERIRRQYSSKLAVIFAGIIVTTVVAGLIFRLHIVSGPPETVVERSTASLAGLMLVTFINLGVAWIVVGGNVGMELRQLESGAERIGNGDFDVDLETERTDEIGALYVSLAEMRDSLETTLEEVTEKERLAQEAKEDARERSEELEVQQEKLREAQREVERQNQELIDEAQRFSGVMEACADGDLSNRLEPQIENEAIEAIADSFNEMLEEITDVLENVQTMSSTVDEMAVDLEASSEQIRDASGDVSESMQEISEGATTQSEQLDIASSNVSELSAGSEEVAAATSDIAETSEDVTASASEGQEHAEQVEANIERLVEMTDSVVETVEALTNEAEQIGEITELIEDVADQTNLLALNANIEASSAGQSGERFSVVANEIKQLAEETMDGVDDIDRRLSAIQDQAAVTAEEVHSVDGELKQTSQLVRQLNEQLTAVNEGIEQVDMRIREIDSTADDQAESAQELSSILTDVTNVSAETSNQSEKVAAASEETTATIEQVSSSADSLGNQAENLASMMSEFDLGARAGSASERKTLQADGGWTDGAAGGNAGGDHDSPDDGARVAEEVDR